MGDNEPSLEADAVVQSSSITIVTPTHNRRESLRRLLLSLSRQDYPWDHVEVVVVADGCRDDTTGMLSALTAELPYRLRWLEEAQGGPAVARNHAIQAATGEIIVFIDDDVVPLPGWLAAHAAHHNGDDRAVVIGPLSPGDRHRPAWVRWEDSVLQKQYRAMLGGVYQPTPRQFYTGNSSVRRRWILEAGGFDARLLRAEDVELAFRLQELGLHFKFDPNADVLHHSYRTLRTWEAIPRQYGRNDVLIANRQSRMQLLAAIGQEFHQRRHSLRLLARLCVGRALLVYLIIRTFGLLIRVGDRLGQDRLCVAACSGTWNLAYWQGIAEALGGRTQFWALVAAGRPGGRANTLGPTERAC